MRYTNSPYIQGKNLWDSLPLDVQSLPTKFKFKIKSINVLLDMMNCIVDYRFDSNCVNQYLLCIVKIPIFTYQ